LRCPANLLKVYFKELAYNLLKSEIQTDQVEDSIKDHIETALSKITENLWNNLEKREK
jgi:hypothetical protein